MRHIAIRNVYPEVVTIRGSVAYDEKEKKITIDEVLIQNEIDKLAVLEVIAHFSAKTNEFIQSKVDEYNLLNGTAFTNVHNCESYSRTIDYPHQTFCNQVWTWSVDVWVAVRAFQETAPTVPTDAEFQAVLDGVAF